MGILLGSLVATTANVIFTPAQIAASIWRLPFLIGGAFGFVAMFLRRWLQETPAFEEIRRRAAISREMGVYCCNLSNLVAPRPIKL